MKEEKFLKILNNISFKSSKDLFSQTISMFNKLGALRFVKKDNKEYIGFNPTIFLKMDETLESLILELQEKKKQTEALVKLFGLEVKKPKEEGIQLSELDVNTESKASKASKKKK